MSAGKCLDTLNAYISVSFMWPGIRRAGLKVAFNLQDGLADDAPEPLRTGAGQLSLFNSGLILALWLV